MTGNADGLRILKKYSQVPPHSIRYVPNPDTKILRSIQDGVLFCMAFWSGSSIQAFTQLTKAIHELEADQVELVVVDVDGSSEIYLLPELLEGLKYEPNAPSGNGEAAFCRDGQIVHAATIGTGPDLNQYYLNAKKFLSASGFH